jgi:hypothetical protein
VESVVSPRLLLGEEVAGRRAHPLSSRLETFSPAGFTCRICLPGSPGGLDAPAMPGRGAEAAARAREDPMARIPIEMANLGYDMETGRIAGWSRRVGDLVEIAHEAGAEVAVGETIGYLDGEA